MAPVVPDEASSEAKSTEPGGGFPLNFEAGADASNSSARRKSSTQSGDALRRHSRELGKLAHFARKFMSNQENAQHVRLTMAHADLTTQRDSLLRTVEKSVSQ